MRRRRILCARRAMLGSTFTRRPSRRRSDRRHGSVSQAYKLRLGGRPYVSDGVLRYGRAGFRGSAGAVWQWTGYDFEAMATPNPELIKDESSTAEVERWTQKDDWSPSVGDSFEFELRGTKIVVTVEGFLNRGATSTPASLRVRLRGHQVEETTTLVESDPAERWFHWREYGELASYGPAPAAPPWIERPGV